MLGSLAFLLQRLAFFALVLLTIIFLTYLGLDMAKGTEFGEDAGRALAMALMILGQEKEY